MPSNLPVIRIRTDEDTNLKIKAIAKYNKRSVSKEIERLLLKHIWEFEAEHGEIKIGWMKPQEFIEDTMDRIMGNPPYEKNKATTKIAKAITGISTGEKLADTVTERSKKGNIEQ